MLLKRGRGFSPQASTARVAASGLVLLALAVAGSLAPRWIVFAQTPLAFEIASVKPAGPPAPCHLCSPPILTSPGLLSAPHATLQQLILSAYGLRVYQLTGDSGWIAAARFDLEAKPTNSASSEQLMLMLRSLLAERFKLAFHKETRELPVYALVVAKNGPKFRTLPASGKSRGLRFSALQGLADYLMLFGSGPVIDKTGLTGNSYLDLDTEIITASAVDAAGGPPSMGELFEATANALEVQLGLKLVSTKAPIEVFVIDYAERPIEN